MEYLIHEREMLKPVVRRGLQGVAEAIASFWKRENEQSDETD